MLQVIKSWRIQILARGTGNKWRDYCKRVGSIKEALEAVEHALEWGQTVKIKEECACEVKTIPGLPMTPEEIQKQMAFVSAHADACEYMTEAMEDPLPRT